MKPWLRYLFGAVTTLLFVASAHAAASVSISAISASPGSPKPGDNVTFTITLLNKGLTTPGDDYAPSGTEKVALSLHNQTTGQVINFAATAIALPSIAGAGGSATVQVIQQIPISTSQAGPCDVTGTLSGGAAGFAGSFNTGGPIVTIVGKPDLKITGLTYPAGTAYKGGDVIAMSLTWTNLVNSGVNNVPFVPLANGDASFFRIEIILSSNPTFGDSDDFLLTAFDINTVENANGLNRTINWNQLLPGNFAGTYYVMAKIDTLSGVSEVIDNDLTINGNNTWFSPDTNATRITLLPTNFPTVYWASANGNNFSDAPSLSADGRYTAYASDSTNLVANDTNNARDIFLFDSQTNTIRRLNLSQQGAQGNAGSQSPAISGNGRAVAFSSDATNLVLGDTNGFSDIFVVDAITGAISLQSVSTAGVQANGSNFKPAVSYTGRYIVFESSATNLVAGGTAVGVTHIYLRDRDVNGSGTFDTPGNTSTTLISQTTGGTPGNGNSIQATISADGKYVAFASDATNLVAAPAVTAGRRHIYLRDLTGAGVTTMVDVGLAAAEANGSSRVPSINRNTGVAAGLTADGRYIAFGSEASNLVAGDGNGVSDIFVYDRVGGTTTRVSLSSANVEGTDPSAAGSKLGSINPSISATGRYVTFASLDSNLAAGDAGGQVASPAIDSNSAVDVFVRDRDVSSSGTYDTPGNVSTTIASVNRFGYQTQALLGTPSTAASDIFPQISADGRWVAFPSDAENTAGLVHGATNRTSPDTNTFRDVFLYDRRINALPNAGVAPTVTITNPGNGSSALVNTPISVTASATTTVGVVSQVQFFVNGTSLGTSTVFPYSATWTPTAVGTYTLSALVTDSFGNLGGSTNVVVTINAAPSVGLVSPVGGSSITVGTVQTVTATAAASNPGATIASVQFFANGTSLGTVTTAPYTVSWTPASTGAYTLNAVAIDSIGTQTTSPNVAVTVIAVGGGGGGGGGALSPPPTVSLSPAPPAGVAVNSSVPLTATATAASGFTIASVQYFANGVSLGSVSAFPYLFSWVPAALGTYTITAVATDNVGTSTTSAAASVVVSTGTAPSVALLSPNSGSSYAVGSPISISASVSLGAGLISQVDFFANNVLIGTKPIAAVSGQGTPPFFNMEWTPAAAGTYVFKAVATDTAGNRTTSTSVTVTVASVAAPVITLTSPTSGTALTVNQTQTISAAATAGTGASIASVKFLANGASVGTASTFPFSTPWTPTAPGTYNLQAVATDSFGTQTTSSVVQVTVGSGSSSLPFVYLTSVPTGTSVTANTPVYVAANAGDPDGFVTNVEFYANGTLIGSAAKAPYAIVWVPTAATTYSVTAVVTDDAGNRVTSAASTITSIVQVGAVPVASLDFNDPSVDVPTAGSTPPAVKLFTPVKVDFGSKLIMAVNPVDQDGSIANVQFFVNGANIATVGAAPYYTTYTLNTLADVTLTAIVTDNSGNAIYTTPILISTQPNDPTGDLVTLVSPLNGSTYTTGGQIIFSATHNFGTANPPKIDFYVNGNQFTTVKPPAGTSSGSVPYTFVVGLSRAGTYDIHAVLRVGTTTTISTPARITVTSNTAPTVSIRTPSTGGSYVIGTPLTIAANAADVDGTLQNVQFFVNGTALSTATVAPYNASWTPGSPGIYTLTAAAVDDAGNQTLSAPVTVTFTGNVPPAVSLSTPSVGARVVAGSAVSLIAAASDVDGTVASVRFLANGNVVGTAATAAPYTTTWTPSASGVYSVVAQATDNSGNVSSSPAVSVNVLVNQPPTVSLSAPTNGAVFRTGAATGLSASANDSDGTIASVQFLANGNVIGSASSAPYSVFWTPSSAGNYAIVAQATDNTGNVAVSPTANVTVLPNQLPVVAFTSPGNGSIVRAGSSTTLSAAASDPDGTIASVQFFANGVSLGSPVTTLSSGGYRLPWTPAAEGIYTITATAIDNSGAATNAVVVVRAVDPTTGGGDTVYTGNFFSLSGGENGKFAVINISGKSAAFIGYSTVGAGKVYFYPSIPVDASGGFTLTDTTGKTLIAGTANDSATTITTLDGAPTTQIGIVASPSNIAVGSGYYTGSLAGRPNSQLAAIVGPDASIILFAADGTTRTAGAGAVNSAGTFTNIPALGGGLFSGKADPATNFLSGNLTGPLAGGMIAAVESGVSFSDGTLRNLSSRGQVGTGNNVLVAGFVVGGTDKKNVLIRAIGPSLAQFGITAALGDPQLQLFGGSGGTALIASNNNWGGTAALFNASTGVGAFALNPTSLDSVILAQLAPGNYTAQVSGVNGATGTALVELYDVDNPTPYSAQKVINISTRAVVGTGQNALIAGFVVGGTTAKKVLVRAVGPTLGAPPFNLAGFLADPVLRIIRNSDNAVIRENDNWEMGNDASLVSDAAVKTGAFALASGSKDSAILISLPPGSYSAQVTGSGSTTGIALVEVYEVP